MAHAADAERVKARAAGAVAALAFFDLLFVATTKVSLVAFGSPVGMAGFLLRAALFVAACALRFPSFERGTIALLVSACLSLAQFHFEGRRMSGDGLMYYVFARSIAVDHDVNLANEYAHYGIANRSDLSMPTDTGYRRSAYPIGPALLWQPFFHAGHALSVVLGPALGLRETDLAGYGPWHVNATALGSWLPGIAALFLIRRLLRPEFSDFEATLATLAIHWATFHEWYLAIQPLMSHAHSAFAAALAVFLWRRFDAAQSRSALWALALGLVIGLAMCVRWQNGLLLLLPAVTAVKRRSLPDVAALGAGLVAGVAPQLLVWKAIYGVYLLEAPPQGTDYVRLTHPYVLNTLFSSRHGLLSWTPVFWLGFLGLAARAWRAAPEARLFAVLVAAMAYVNMCVGDWWGGGSYSARRFDSALPLLAPGFAAAIAFAARLAHTRPGLVPALAACVAIAWNVGLARNARSDAPASDPVVAAARGFTRAFGFPTTWPASWIFALKHGTTPDRYDRAQGRYLFYRQGNLNGRIDVGRAPDAFGDDDLSLVLDGFSERIVDGRFTARRIERAGRILAPLDLPEDIVVGVRTRTENGAEANVTLIVNGEPIETIRALPVWNTIDVSVPRFRWKPDMNEVTLRTDDPVLVDIFIFKRESRT